MSLATCLEPIIYRSVASLFKWSDIWFPNNVGKQVCLTVGQICLYKAWPLKWSSKTNESFRVGLPQPRKFWSTNVKVHALHLNLRHEICFFNFEVRIKLSISSDQLFLSAAQCSDCPVSYVNITKKRSGNQASCFSSRSFPNFQDRLAWKARRERF